MSSWLVVFESRTRHRIIFKHVEHKGPDDDLRWIGSRRNGGRKEISKKEEEEGEEQVE